MVKAELQMYSWGFSRSWACSAGVNSWNTAAFGSEYQRDGDIESR